MKVVFVRDAERVSRRSRSGLLIHFSDGNYREVNVRDVEVLVILGSKVLVESGVVSLLSSFNVPLTIVSGLGVSLLSTHMLTYCNEVRRAQYALDGVGRSGIMLEILFAKFRGLSNIVKYYGGDDPGLHYVEDLERGASLLWWEAANSKVYWDRLLGLIPDDVLRELRRRYGFEGRRPKAKDPFNRCVSLLYAVLYSIVLRALVASGLDPTEGLNHKTRYSTPLVFDYVEMYKPIAVHTVIKAFRGGDVEMQLDEDCNLTKKSMNTLLKKFFDIMQARIRNTRLTPYRSIYVNAYRLAERIRGRTDVKYTFTYNPKKLALRE